MDPSIRDFLEKLANAIGSEREIRQGQGAVEWVEWVTVPAPPLGGTPDAIAAGVYGILLGLRLAGALTEAEYDEWRRRLDATSAKGPSGSELPWLEPASAPAFRPAVPAAAYDKGVIRLDMVERHPAGSRLGWVVDLREEEARDNVEQARPWQRGGELPSLLAYTLALHAAPSTQDLAMSDDTGQGYECLKIEARFGADWRTLELATWFTPAVSPPARVLQVTWGGMAFSCELPA